MYKDLALMTATWGGLGLLFNFLTNRFKVTRNFISTIHATGVILTMFFTTPMEYLYLWSVSYYILDGLYELLTIYKTRQLYNLGMMLHHGVTIGVLNYLLNPLTASYMKSAFLLSEISNIPMYLVYHLKANNCSYKKLIKILILTELIAFAYCRLWLGSQIFYEITFEKDMPKPMSFSGLIILLISCSWTIKLFKQVIH